MKIVYHRTLTPERWKQMSFAEQMSNVGSDVFRAIRWRSKDGELFRQALERALELLDLTIEVSAGSGPRLRELARLREALVDYFLFDNSFGSSDHAWETYFGAFDIAASKVRASRSR